MVVMADNILVDLASRHATETAFIITALGGLSALRTVVISRDLQRTYSSSVRKRNLAKHPPSMIMAAVMVAGSNLEHVIMCACTTGSFYGVKPRTWGGFLNEMKRLSKLKALSLNLTSRNRR